MALEVSGAWVPGPGPDEPGGVGPGSLALAGDKVRQIHHPPAVAAGKDAGDIGLQACIGEGPVGDGVQPDTSLSAYLVFRDEAHREEQGVAVHPPLGAGDGLAAVVQPAQLHPLQPFPAENGGDGVAQVEGDAEVVQALAHVAPSPPGTAFISATHRTVAPSRVSRRAMMSPMSPEPKMTTRRPTIRFLVFIRFWAAPAV